MKRIAASTAVLAAFLLLALLAVDGVTPSGHSEAAPIEEEQFPETGTSTPLLFVGDIMLGRYVETLARESGDGLRSFRNVAPYLREAVAIGNLEGPIPEQHVQTPINGFSFSFPSSTPALLARGGIAAVSLANNHMFDKGRDGWEHTRRALEAQGIAYFGGYAPTEADYFSAKLGTRMAIVYGVTMIATGWNEEQALEVTRNLRKEHKDAYLVAFLHWGDEYEVQTAYQRAFGHKLIDNGADAIIGSHPHVVQGIETYQGKPIIYSLGNFIFDQYWRDDVEDGLAVRLSDAGSSYVYELLPIRSERSVPSFATGTEKLEILKSVSELSEPDLRGQILQGELRIRK